MKRSMLLWAALVCCCLALFAKETDPTESYNYQRGVEAIRNDNLEEGMEFLRKELRQNPKNGYAFAWMAMAQHETDERGSAIQSLQSALKYLPKSEKSLRAWSHNMMATIQFELCDTIAGLASLAQAIKTNPQEEDWYDHRGLIYSEMGQYDKAEADFCKEISVAPGLIRGFIQLGRVRMKQERYADALELFTKADNLASRSYTLSFMASAEYKLRQFETAAKHVIDALKMESMEDGAVDLLMENQDDEYVDLLRAQLKVQIAKNPNDPDWMYYLLLVEQASREYEKAIELCRRISKIDPDAFYDATTAILYEQMGDYENALVYINEAIKGDTTSTSYYLYRADYYCSLDSIEPMYRDMDKLIERYPERAKFYSQRASFHFMHGEYAQAIEDYNTALALDPDLSFSRYMRGRCHVALGDTAKANKDFRRIVNTRSKDTRLFVKIMLNDDIAAEHELAEELLKEDSLNYRYNVMCAFSLMGDTVRAMSELEKVLEEGYVDFWYLRHDPDLVPIHSDAFDALLARYEQKTKERIARFNEREVAAIGTERVVEVPFTAANGVTKVDCTINGLPLSFVFDTGASDVTISQTEANFMLKNGYLSKKDVVGQQHYQTADGNVSVGTTFILHKINFGGLELSGIRASVVQSQKAPLLLGQTVLQRLGKIEIDNERKVLKITTKQ